MLLCVQSDLEVVAHEPGREASAKLLQPLCCRIVSGSSGFIEGMGTCERTWDVLTLPPCTVETLRLAKTFASTFGFALTVALPPFSLLAPDSRRLTPCVETEAIELTVDEDLATADAAKLANVPR